MTQYLVITGHTNPEYDIVGTGPSIRREKIAESFETKLNAKLRELEKQGITPHVDIKPAGPNFHHGYLSWGEPKTDSATMDAKEVAHILGFGETTIYEMIERGELIAISSGRRKRVLRSSVDRLLSPT